MRRTWIRCYYFDASAIVKLFVDEEHSDLVREFLNSIPKPVFATPICLAEAFGVFKAKWNRKELNDAAYLTAVLTLNVNIGDNSTFQEERYGFGTPYSMRDIQDLAAKYPLDFSDLLQILTVSKGRHSLMAGESATVLVTADKGLRDAAKSEGLQVWYPGEPVPL